VDGHVVAAQDILGSTFTSVISILRAWDESHSRLACAAADGAIMAKGIPAAELKLLASVLYPGAFYLPAPTAGTISKSLLNRLCGAIAASPQCRPARTRRRGRFPICSSATPSLGYAPNLTNNLLTWANADQRATESDWSSFQGRRRLAGAPGRR
jgi:hypothetical protein